MVPPGVWYTASSRMSGFPGSCGLRCVDTTKVGVGAGGKACAWAGGGAMKDRGGAGYCGGGGGAAVWCGGASHSPAARRAPSAAGAATPSRDGLASPAKSQKHTISPGNMQEILSFVIQNNEELNPP